HTRSKRDWSSDVCSSDLEQSKRHAFDSFCKKVLKQEARDYYDELKRQRDREVSFSDLSEKELAQLYTEDNYFVSEQIFNVLGLNVIVTDDVIAEALQSLPERKRDIILLSYFLELSDREIGDKLNMLRSTVQYQRTNNGIGAEQRGYRPVLIIQNNTGNKFSPT